MIKYILYKIGLIKREESIRFVKTGKREAIGIIKEYKYTKGIDNERLGDFGNRGALVSVLLFTVMFSLRGVLNISDSVCLAIILVYILFGIIMIVALIRTFRENTK